MGKGTYGLGGIKHAGANPRFGRELRCVACHCRIVWGERCENCKRELAARKRRRRR